MTHRILLGVTALLAMACAHHAPPAEAVLTDFYHAYLDASSQRTSTRPSLPFSRDLQARMNDNKAMCQALAEGDVCGWNADSDPYLAAQDYDDDLNFKNSGFAVEALPNQVFRTSFNIAPSAANAGDTQIDYPMIVEDGRWVVDNIIYHDRMTGTPYSLRDMMAQERDLYPQWKGMPNG